MRAELAAAADVGHDVNAALLQPGRADAGAVAGQHGDLESAVAVEQGRVVAVEGQPFLRDLEVGNPRAVLGGRLVLADLEALGVEEGGQALELLAFRRPSVPRTELDGRQEVGDGQEVVVRLMRSRSRRRWRCRTRGRGEAACASICRSRG